MFHSIKSSSASKKGQNTTDQILWLEGIYEVGEGWVAGVGGGEGDEVGWEVNVAWEEGGDESYRAESW